jgi:hypothetical protein
MTQPHITQTLYIDPYPAAEALEFELAQFLLPPEEVGLPEDLNGKNGRWYDQTGNVLIKDPVLEERPAQDVVIRRRHHHREANPVRGLAMVGDTIAWILNDLAKWKKPIASAQTCDVLGIFANPESSAKPDVVVPLSAPLRGYFKTSKVANEDFRNHEGVLNRATDLLLDIRSEVVSFVGRDHWIMHFYGRQGRDYIIEKTIDFRIYDWERRMESGEWQ